MHDSGPLVGIQTQKLLEAIQTSSMLLKIYQSLIMLAPTETEKKKLGQMYTETTKSFSEVSSLYMKLTGSPPTLSTQIQPNFTNYLDGIETAILVNMYLARLYVQLYPTIVPDMANLFIRNSAEKNSHASTLNFIYAAHLSGHQELLNI